MLQKHLKVSRRGRNKERNNRKTSEGGKEINQMVGKNIGRRSV
jgi:hypothetical protein